MNDSAAEALSIIRYWEWTEGGFGFDDGPKWRPLSETINSLAFDGHADPAGAILKLLADDALMARGDYEWSACRNGSRFSQQGNGLIPVKWWRLLRKSHAEYDWVSGAKIDLPWLEISDAPPAVWAWNDNRISSAHKNGNNEFDVAYTEEWFSVWHVEVHCPSAGTGFTTCDDSSLAEGDDRQPETPSAPTIAHSTGRPPKYDWEGALAHITAVANTPDGLETGPGAQAAIERLIADYFTRASKDGSAPCESEIRKRANRVMKAIEALKPPLSKVA